MSGWFSGGKSLKDHYSKNFVPIPDATHSCGRKVYIEKSKLDEFTKLIRDANANFNTLYFYKQISSLRNIGTATSLVSKKTVFSRKLTMEGGSVLYSIYDGNAYITQVEVDTNYKYEKGKRNISAGVYKARRENSGDASWSVKGGDNTVQHADIMNTKNLAINGRCKDIQDAANFMPQFIKYGYGESSLSNTYSLFFNPNHGAISSGWRAMRDSTGISGTQSAKKLAEVLLMTGAKNQEVSLTVHESGHALFKEALRIVKSSNQKLDQYTVFYANPTQNLQLVDRLRQQVGMKLCKKEPLINPVSISQNIASLNVVSGFVVSERANPENRISNAFNFVKSAPSYYGLAGYAAATTTAIGAAGWALSAVPFLVGQAPGMNKKVVTNDAQAFQEGVKSYKKLIWDPVHKMMVKG